MKDKKLVCVDCHNEFTLTEGEQKFFVDKGYSEPKRCKPCRDIKKQNQRNY